MAGTHAEIVILSNCYSIAPTPFSSIEILNNVIFTLFNHTEPTKFTAKICLSNLS